MHRMAIRTPPFGALVNRHAIEERRRIGGAVSNATGKVGLLGAE